MVTKKTKPTVTGTKPAVPLKTVPGLAVPAVRVPGIKPVPGIVVPKITPGIVPKVSPGIKPVPGLVIPGLVPKISPVIVSPGFVPRITPGVKPPKYPKGEIVQINLSKYCAVELLNALVIALGIVPPGKKTKKGKKP